MMSASDRISQSGVIRLYKLDLSVNLLTSHDSEHISVTTALV